MRHYEGLDVSLEDTTICVIDETGAASDRESLVEVLEKAGLPLDRVGWRRAAWMHEGLMQTVVH